MSFRASCIWDLSLSPILSIFYFSNRTYKCSRNLLFLAEFFLNKILYIFVQRIFLSLFDAHVIFYDILLKKKLYDQVTSE